MKHEDSILYVTEYQEVPQEEVDVRAKVMRGGEASKDTIHHFVTLAHCLISTRHSLILLLRSTKALSGNQTESLNSRGKVRKGQKKVIQTKLKMRIVWTERRIEI